MTKTVELPQLDESPLAPLERVQKAQLEKGLVLARVAQFLPATQWILEHYGDDITQFFPSSSGTPRFVHAVDLHDPTLFEQLGELFFTRLAPLIGYQRKTDPGDIMEASGLILYPPDNPGYDAHSDKWHYSWPMARITVAVEGEGNHWAANTGTQRSMPGDVMFQDLTVGILHSMNTIRCSQRRVAAFWDIPAESAAAIVSSPPPV